MPPEGAIDVRVYRARLDLSMTYDKEINKLWSRDDEAQCKDFNTCRILASGVQGL